MHEEEAVESPRKRLKVDDTQTKDNDVVIPANSNIGASSSAAQTSSREIDVGITEFVSRDIPGFEGILKRRFVFLFPIIVENENAALSLSLCVCFDLFSSFH